MKQEEVAEEVSEVAEAEHWNVIKNSKWSHKGLSKITYSINIAYPFGNCYFFIFLYFLSLFSSFFTLLNMLSFPFNFFIWMNM